MTPGWPRLTKPGRCWCRHDRKLTLVTSQLPPDKWHDDIGILFTPANQGESQRLERIGHLSTGAQFYHYRVNIRGDISASQTPMTQEVQAVLTATSEGAPENRTAG